MVVATSQHLMLVAKGFFTQAHGWQSSLDRLSLVLEFYHMVFSFFLGCVHPVMQRPEVCFFSRLCITIKINKASFIEK
jgi:hypothetical protein